MHSEPVLSEVLDEVDSRLLRGPHRKPSCLEPFAGFLLIAAPIALGALTRPVWGFVLFGVEMVPGALWAIGQTTWWEIQENRDFYGERYRDAWWFAAKTIAVSMAITLALEGSRHGATGCSACRLIALD